MDGWKRINMHTPIFNFFHNWVATPFYSFHAKRYSNIPTGIPPPPELLVHYAFSIFLITTVFFYIVMYVCTYSLFVFAAWPTWRIIKHQGGKLLTARCPGNGKRGTVPMKSAADTSNQRNAMISQGTDYDTGSVTSFGTPTQRHYHREHQQQRQTNSINPYNDARLNSHWSPRRRQPILQKLLVSRTSTDRDSNEQESRSVG